MDWQERNIQIAKAQAALSIRAGCGVEEALAIMRIQFAREQRTLDEIAQVVLHRKGRFGA